MTHQIVSTTNYEIYTDLECGDNQMPVVYQAIFREHCENAVLETHIPFNDILTQFIEMNSIPDGTVTVQQRTYLMAMFSQLKATIDKNIHEVQNMQLADGK